MRRRGAVAVLAGMLTVMLLPVAAQAQDLKIYTGHLSDGGRIAAGLIHGPQGNIRLRVIQFQVVFGCEDGSSQEWIIGFGIFPGLAMPDRVLAFDIVDPDLAVHVHGTFGSRHASGDLSAAIPALTEDEQAQLCTTGALTWTMRRRHFDRIPRNRDALDGRIRVRIGRDGEPVVRVRPA